MPGRLVELWLSEFGALILKFEIQHPDLMILIADHGGETVGDSNYSKPKLPLQLVIKSIPIMFGIDIVKLINNADGVTHVSGKGVPYICQRDPTFI